MAALTAWSAPAAERRFNFGDYPLNQPPPGFRSTVAGRGKPGDWKVILDDIPSALPPLTSKVPEVNRRAVLAQLARNGAGDRLAMLIFDGEAYGDFKFTTRFKTVGGALDQMAGVVFHYLDESNFYFVSASALENHFRCYKVLDGELKPPLGPSVEISAGEWHDLAVQCEGTRIVCSLDGKELIKLIDSSANYAGKIGFCTRLDSASYFVDGELSYSLRENPALKLVAEALKDYPRLLDLKIYAARAGGKEAVVVASKDAKEIGQPAGKTEQDVISRGTAYFGKAKNSTVVTVPLRDRNGDSIAAVSVTLKSFPGQTEANALVRAQVVVRAIQTQVQSLEDLVQ